MKKLFTIDRLLGIVNFFAKCVGMGQSEKLYRFNHRIHQVDFKKLHFTHPLIPDDLKAYFDSDSKPYSLVTIGTESRPATVCNFNEPFTLNLPPNITPSDQIWLSFAVIEPLPPQYGFKDGRCYAKISLESSIVNSKGEVIHTGTFNVPLEFVNPTFLHRSGEGWLSWSISAADFLKKLSSSQEPLKLIFHPKLISDEETPQTLPAPVGACCLALPQIVTTKKRPKKIIALSCESLTDPKVLKYMFPKESAQISPQVFEFMEKYGAAGHSYSQGDSTLPASNAQLSGLLALQHGIGCYNPSAKAPNTPVRNDAILSPAQLLKRVGFLTFGSTRYIQLCPDYGCARGFDSYVNLDCMRYPARVDLEAAVILPMESCKNADSYHYLHLDWLMHGPFIDTRFSDFSGINDLEDISKRDRAVNLYLKNLNTMFRQIQSLCDYIERNQEHTDFLLMITGDHGHGLEPWWENKKDFALYEQRIRTPFIMKDFSRANRKLDPALPVNASLEIYKNSIAFAGVELPSLIAGLPQYRREFDGLSISETILHPMDDDYCLVLSDRKFKYAVSHKIDYDARKLLGTSWEKLFQYDELMPDETVDVKARFPEILKQFQKKAEILVREGLEFNSKYPAMSSLEPAHLWTVKHPLSPSSKKRRPKRK